MIDCLTNPKRLVVKWWSQDTKERLLESVNATGSSGQFTLFFDLFLSNFLLVLLQVVGVHLLERIGRGVVGLVDARVVLLITSYDSFGDGSKHDRGVLSTQAGQILFG